ncbi:MAG: hypothetical protein ABR72_03760, partial [OM182 bacterium BACL3 MAG-120920-bin41]
PARHLHQVPHDFGVLEGIAAFIQLVSLQAMKPCEPLDNSLTLRRGGFAAEIELGAITGRDDHRLVNRLDLAQLSERALNHLWREGNLLAQGDSRRRVINPD